MTVPLTTTPVYAASGLFVCFEGGDGVGKSTQAQYLQERLHQRGYQVVLTLEPGGTAVGKRLRQLLLDPATGALEPRTETLLYLADKVEHVARVVQPALDQGAVVITDRYTDSTMAYQGAGRDIDSEQLRQLLAWSTFGLRPHLTILLDAPPRLGLARVSQPDRIEAESEEFHHRVREGFLAQAERDPEHYFVVDADHPRQQIAAAIWERVEPLL